MSEFVRKTGPVIVTFFCAFVIFANYFFTHPIISQTATILRTSTTLISAFALALGAANLLMVNYQYIRTKRAGLWMYAPIYIILFPVLGVLGLIGNPIYSFSYNFINLQISAAIDGFQVFFMAIGVYRTIKIKNLESLILFASAFFAVMGKIPIGGLIWAGLQPISDWFYFYPGVAAVRTLLILNGFGVLSIGIRAILGHERSHLGQVGGE